MQLYPTVIIYKNRNIKKNEINKSYKVVSCEHSYTISVTKCKEVQNVYTYRNIFIYLCFFSFTTNLINNNFKVVARQQQQRLLAQQTVAQTTEKVTKSIDNGTNSRLNGARQLFSDGEDTTDVSTTQISSTQKSRREPPQPPPPPLAPLSNAKGKTVRIDNEDSDSIGNNSLASSTGIGNIGLGCVSSTEDGDNSLTSFEGLLNGIPSIDNPLALNDDSNSKDSIKCVAAKKPLMLADLLEKKIDKDPLMLNGVLGKDIGLSEKGIDLVENHIEKVLSKENNVNENSSMDTTCSEKSNEEVTKPSLKRVGSCDLSEPENKKMHLSNVNGNADSPAPGSISSSIGEEQPTEKVSTAAAKLFADMAADILEDEDEEELLQESRPQIENSSTMQLPQQNNSVPQMFMDTNQQVLITQPRQIIVSQPQLQPQNQVVIPAGAQLKTQSGQTVIVQNSAQQRPQVMQQANPGPILLSQGLQGQMQLVASSAQPGQYLIQTGGTQGAYVVAQSQTAMVHGQPQTVLVAQTTQQQGTGAKTIIILQQQPATNTATHHQKVMVTPQGQQVVVTPVQRPILQTSTVSNSPIAISTIKTLGSNVITQTNAANSNSLMDKKLDEPKVIPKTKIVRDLTSPYVCEWGDCQM